MHTERKTSTQTRPPVATGVGWRSLAAVVAGADQAIKHEVHAGLRYGDAIPFAGFFNIVHQWNTGAAFRFLADAGGWQRYVLTAIALIVPVVLGWMLTKPLRKIEAIGYSLIFGGAVGNVIDRINRDNVVDFLDFHWPAFNLPDIGICAGSRAAGCQHLPRSPSPPAIREVTKDGSQEPSPVTHPEISNERAYEGV